FFDPSPKEVVYHGAYNQLDGVRMSEAYRSTVSLSFDVRAGLVMRQMHHWAALTFLAAIVTHLCRVFFTGAFRRPRELNWIVRVAIGGLVGVHLAILWRQKHTQYRGRGRTERNVVGSRLWPTYTLKSVGLFALVVAVLGGLGGLVQVNPVWLYGPFEPSAVTTA